MSFFDDMLPYAQQASQKTDIPTSVILAQWAHESAFGQSDLAKRANNYAGIKYWGDNYINDGQSGMYANYNSTSRFADAWSQFMGGQRYAGVRNADTPEATIKALGQSGYAEDSNYFNALSNMIDKYDLKKYDNGSYSGSGKSSLFGGLDQKKNNGLDRASGDSPFNGGLEMIQLDRLAVVDVNGKKIGGIVLDGKTYVYVRDAFEVVSYDETTGEIKAK